MRRIHTILTILVLIMLVSTLWFYWLMNFKQVNLSLTPTDTNFTIGVYDPHDMQFYDNMRYVDKNITYKIADKCTLQKKDAAERAFLRLQNTTILTFTEVDNNEEILVTCDSKTKEIDNGFFVAGEGGPVNITRDGQFNVIKYGEVLLIRESQCPQPNIATHEILHALGFNHSKNPDNIMYPVTSCEQTIGDDIPTLLNELYSIPSLPDLEIINVTPDIQGKYLSFNITIANYGLQPSQNATLDIYADSDFIQSFNISSMNIGTGANIELNNIYLTTAHFRQLIFTLKTNSEEINKKNNEVRFEIQK